MHRLVSALGLLLLAGGALRGEPPPGVKTIRVVLHPAVPPVPALRYALLPELRHQKPGNAVPHYRKAVSGVKVAISSLDDKKWYERVDQWREMPLDQLPRDTIRAFLRTFEALLREVEDGARHEYADWGLSDNLRKSGIATLFPDLQEMRQFATFLALRVRLAVAEGRLEDAVRDLQTIYAVARHVGQAPTLICSLIGMSLSGIASQQLDELIQHPAAPNFYWALTDLPQPYLDLRAALQGERVMAYGTFPGLPMTPGDPAKPMTEQESEKVVQLLLGLKRGELPIPEAAYKLHMALDIQRKHEAAKGALVAAGWRRDALDKMPHLQVGLLHALLEYDQRMDELSKWNNLPYWQAAPALLALTKPRPSVARLPGPNQPAIPLADEFVANTGSILFSRTRLDRKIAALRCVEAIRLYAAGHGGKLPPTLDAIKEVPIPVDPFTGKPFEYAAGPDRATLYATALARPIQGRTANAQDALLYEIVLKK